MAEHNESFLLAIQGGEGMKELSILLTREAYKNGGDFPLNSREGEWVVPNNLDISPIDVE